MNIENITRRSTYLMIVLALLGNIPGTPEIYGMFLYPFRLLYPPYIALLILFILNKKEVEITKTTVLFFAFICYIPASLIWSINPQNTLINSLSLLATASLSIGIWITSKNREIIHRYLLLITGIGIIALGLAGYEMITGHNLSVSRFHGRKPQALLGYYATAWFYNINKFTFFMLLSVIYPTSLALTSWLSIRERILYLAPLGIGVFIFINLSSRAILLSTIIIIGYIIAVGRDRVPNGIRQFRTNRIVTTIFGLATIGLLVVFSLIPNPASKGSSIYIRWELQSTATSYVLSNPIGVGYRNTESILLSLARVTKDIGAPHSLYGRIILDFGLVGLLLAVTLFGVLISQSSKYAIARNNPVETTTAAWMVALPVSSLAPANPIVQPTLWVGIGLVLAVIQLNCSS
ncbi:hypothetical protein [Halobacterium sp. BOL4-2]|uniref:O-antigen ligase family protein n=1 Tax=Halobacterium sp. BOL4-2 TaxID=2810537 RepID=UPI00196232D6|nr:hypothetical protein [Halobacterium sp. BOL4-2]QRY24867.1 hypothetical protein JRZ79_00235 [Halobacterium sp. BOL4-2]